MGIAVQRMFDGIATRYDFLNHFLSAGRDRSWRHKAALSFHEDCELKILDLCGGTGDFWKSWRDLQFTNPNKLKDEGFKVFGVVADFSLPMLKEARRKFLVEANKGLPIPALVRMDALKPCFKTGKFDAVICAYGMRNLDSVQKGIEEILPLLVSGGTFLTLEFFRPTNLFTRVFYHGLAPLCIPLIGYIFSSRREAYQYLVQSIQKFKSVFEYQEIFRQNGFVNVSIVACDFGISHIVTAKKG